METTILKKILKEFKEGLNINKNILDEAIEEGELINIDKIIDIVGSYENVKEQLPEKKYLAVFYSGNPEITLTYMLDSILYNNRIVLCVEKNKAITEVIYTIFNETLINLKLKNEWVEYSSEYNELFLQDNENKFDKIVYIGDYFEYQKFKFFFQKNIEYNNYGYIKIFIDKVKYKEEYKKIIKYTYIANIILDVYNNIDDFIKESTNEDFSVIYADLELADKIKKEAKFGEILVNTFPYESYKFKINR